MERVRERRHLPIARRAAVLAAGCALVLLVAAFTPRAGEAPAGDVAAVVASLKNRKAECAYLRDLCDTARAAKWGARAAMDESRANHERSRAMSADADNSGTRDAIRLQDRAVQEHLTAMSRRRAETAAALRKAQRMITARHDGEVPCGGCPGIE